jgi:hypothetical protein
VEIDSGGEEGKSSLSERVFVPPRDFLVADDGDDDDYIDYDSDIGDTEETGRPPADVDPYSGGTLFII